jgi:hypothetical protein
LTGVTIVRRDSPWDEDSRETAYALWTDERERCPDCGQPRDVCSDPNVDYYAQKAICWATAARKVNLRRWEKKTEDARPDAAGYLPDDGATVWVSRIDLTPDEDFLAPAVFQPGNPRTQTEGGD